MKWPETAGTVSSATCRRTSLAVPVDVEKLPPDLRRRPEEHGAFGHHPGHYSARTSWVKYERSLPTMLNYETHIAKSSAFNTPPVYAIYISMLTMQWVKQTGGLIAMANRNQAKAKLLYDAIDASPCFVGVAATEDRSLMNATFVMKEEQRRSG